MESKDSENPRLNKRKNVENLTDKATNKARETQTHVKSNKLKVFYTNADSLLNKIDELKLRISSEDYDIVCVTEVKPKNSRYEMNPSEIQLDGYNLFHNISESGRGIATYIKTESKATIISDTSAKFNEALLLSVNTSGADNLFIGCFYRSPNSSCENNEQLNELIANLSKIYKGILIIGDFNYPLINWNTWSFNIKDKDSKEIQFIETIRDSYLDQIIKQPTRYRCNEKSNVLDLVFTDNEQWIENLENIKQSKLNALFSTKKSPKKPSSHKRTRV